MADKVCVICGAVFHPRNICQICCSKKCSDENNRRITKDRNKTWKKEKQEKTQKANEALALQRPSVCDRFCDGCVFMAWANGSCRVCEYFFHTGQRRPCPAGTGCTVKQKGKKKTSWRYEADRTWKNKEKQKKEPVVYHRACPTCGTEFDTTAKNKVYCSKKCKDKAYRDGRIVMKVHTKVCQLCGKEFDTKDAKQRYCSITCRNLASWKRVCQREKEKKNGTEA